MNLDTVFIITVIVNILLVSFGANVETVLGDFFDEDSAGDPSSISAGMIGAVNPENFTINTINTGETTGDFKLADSLGLIKSGLLMLLSILIAPLLMGISLGWPPILVWLVCVPWTLVFWMGLLKFIRGLS